MSSAPARATAHPFNQATAVAGQTDVLGPVLRSDVLIAARRYGVKPRQVVFSNARHWRGRPCSAVIDRAANTITLFVDVIANGCGGQARERTLEVLRDAIVELQRANEDVDYIQDPDTGRFEGSRPGGGDGGGGGEAYGFASPNVLSDLDLKGAVHQLGGKQQAALEK